MNAFNKVNHNPEFTGVRVNALGWDKTRIVLLPDDVCGLPPIRVLLTIGNISTKLRNSNVGVYLIK